MYHQSKLLGKYMKFVGHINGRNTTENYAVCRKTLGKRRKWRQSRIWHKNHSEAGTIEGFWSSEDGPINKCFGYFWLKQELLMFSQWQPHPGHEFGCLCPVVLTFWWIAESDQFCLEKFLFSLSLKCDMLLPYVTDFLRIAQVVFSEMDRGMRAILCACILVIAVASQLSRFA